jgi:hypothetical protein
MSPLIHALRHQRDRMGFLEKSDLWNKMCIFHEYKMILKRNDWCFGKKHWIIFEKLSRVSSMATQKKSYHYCQNDANRSTDENFVKIFSKLRSLRQRYVAHDDKNHHNLLCIWNMIELRCSFFSDWQVNFKLNKFFLVSEVLGGSLQHLTTGSINWQPPVQAN